MSIYPSTKWYQDIKNLYLTISEPDLDNIKHEFHEQKLIFSATKNEQKYEMTLNFFQPILINKSILKSKGCEINIIITKKEPQWWSYLVSEKKLNYIYVDWNGWKDEFDSDDDLYDYKLPDNFQEMMGQMKDEMQDK